MPTLPLDGCDLYYEEHGRGQGILFIHGLVTDASTWDDQVARLAPHFRCVTYDRRGSTRSFWVTPGSPPLERHARDAAELIRALKIEGCLVVASSLGGVIALELMRRFPELVRGAVLSEPALLHLVPGEGDELVARASEAVGHALESAGPHAAVEAFARQMDDPAWKLTSETERHRMQANHRALFRVIEGERLRVEADEISRISVPSLVLRGDKSPKAFRMVVERLARLLPSARMIEIANSGHLLYFHQPELFERTVREFAAASPVPGGAGPGAGLVTARDVISCRDR